MENVLLQTVEELLEQDSPIDAESDLFEAGLDSMGIMQLLLIIEEEFAVQIPVSELTRENFATVHSIAQLVREKSADSE